MPRETKMYTQKDVLKPPTPQLSEMNSIDPYSVVGPHSFPQALHTPNVYFSKRKKAAGIIQQLLFSLPLAFPFLIFKL